MTANVAAKPALIACVLLFGSVAAWPQPAWTPIWKWSKTNLRCPIAETRPYLTRRAANGEAEAQDQLGSYHVSTCAGEKDPAEGVRLLERAALQGNVHAQFMLGVVYRGGWAVTTDLAKAVSWTGKAALGDSGGAQNDYGMLLQFGRGVPKNEANAARMFRLAAQQGLTEAKYNLATMYDTGKGVSQDYVQARQWYERAATDNKGEADAEYRLGILDEQGLGADDKDPSGAVAWFEKAAEHGSVNAALRLAFNPPAGELTLPSEHYLLLAGDALANGRGVARDEPRGFTYVKAAAEKRYEPAMFTLATMYDNGRGTPKNEAKALETYDQLIAVNDKHYMAYNNFAWICVTAEDPKLRNPQKALPYALKGVELSGGKGSAELDTLARVYFMLGDIDKAIDLQKKAISYAPDRDNYKKALEEYQAAKNHPKAAK